MKKTRVFFFSASHGSCYYLGQSSLPPLCATPTPCTSLPVVRVDRSEKNNNNKNQKKKDLPQSVWSSIFSLLFTLRLPAVWFYYFFFAGLTGLIFGLVLSCLRSFAYCALTIVVVVFVV